MTLLNRKGVSVVSRHTFNTNKDGEEVFSRTFIADEHELKNPQWRYTKMCDFLQLAYETMLELKGEEYFDYSIPVNEPIIEPYENDESLCPQVSIRFSAILPGRKELN